MQKKNAPLVGRKDYTLNQKRIVMAHKGTKRNRTRAAQKRNAIKENT